MEIEQMGNGRHGVPDDAVRDELAGRYALMASQFEPRSQNNAWLERMAAVIAGDVLVEPGWMLRDIVGEAVELHGVYRVYRDGRIERDRYLEHKERVRLFGTAADELVTHDGEP